MGYYAQKQNVKAFGTGISISGTSREAPNLAKTPYLFYRQNHHQVFVGLDIYNLKMLESIKEEESVNSNRRRRRRRKIIKQD